MSPAADLLPLQTTLDQGIPLSEVTFCVVDLETTGGSPTSSRITEIGAVKYRGGELLGEFQALVDPGVAIPSFIERLTGISNTDVIGRPPIEAALPTFLEFMGPDAVFVAHNARFDHGFLSAELARLDYPPLPPQPVCTARLARRVVWPDVPNVKLHTLAQYFRVRVQPSHRALPDAQACAEVLHGLLELGGRLGIMTLGDLHHAVRARGRPHFNKIRMTDHLPETAGVYLFRGSDGSVLYVGKSKNVRARAKTYFYGDGRKKVEDLLSEATSIEAVPCATELEALVRESRLIREHEPKYNRRGKGWRRYAYLKLDTGEAFPRLKVVREVKDDTDRAVYLGPLRSSGQAHLIKEALEEFSSIRRCTKSMGASTRFAACALADMGRCPAPCDGRTDTERYGELVEGLIRSLSSPDELLAALETRMHHLSGDERFEEAALARDRLRAVTDLLARRRIDDWLLAANSLTLLDAGTGTALRFDRGALATAPSGSDGGGTEPIPGICPRDRADELAEVRRWLARNPVRLAATAAAPSEPIAGGATIHRLQTSFRTSDRTRNIDRPR